jgi:hypothetical protein
MSWSSLCFPAAQTPELAKKINATKGLFFCLAVIDDVSREST